MKTTALKRERLLEVLRYDPSTGQMYWRISRGTRIAGAVAGNHRIDGYVYIAIDKVLYRRTRLIWLYVHGKWPSEHIDHINRDTSDDKLTNLREATRSQNLGNRKINKNNSTGFKGVFERDGRFRAYVNVNGRRLNIGTYSTAEQAGAAYMVKAREMFGEFARLR